MKIPNKNTIVISIAGRNPLSKDHAPVRFLDSPSGRFPRNDSNVFRIFGFQFSASLKRKLVRRDLCFD